MKGTRQGNMTEIFRNKSIHMTLKLGTLRELRYPDMDSQATKLCQSDPFMTEGHNPCSLTLGNYLCPVLLISIGPTAITHGPEKV